MSHEFDPRAIPGSRGERRITSQQRCPKRFGEGDVCGVVRCDIMTKFPDPEQKEIMRVSGQRKIHKIFERLEPPSGIKFTGPGIPAKDLRDFDIEPALFTRVRDETAETPGETGARSREGGKHT